MPSGRKVGENKSASKAENAAAREIAANAGSLRAGVIKFILGSPYRTQEFTTHDIASEMGISRHHVSGVLYAWKNSTYKVEKVEGTRRYHLVPREDTEVSTSAIELNTDEPTSVTVLVLRQETDTDYLLWMGGEVYYAMPYTGTTS